MSKITSCIFTSTILICVLLLCCNLTTKSVPANLTVSSGNNSNFSRMIRDHNSFTTVDGLRLWIYRIELSESEGEYIEENVIWESSDPTGTMIDLRSSVDIATISSKVDLPLKTISEIVIGFFDHFEIKTFTYLSSNSTYYYTANSGIQSTGSFDPNNPPSDYDFLAYSFIYPSGHPTDITSRCLESMFYPEKITIIEGVEYNFDIYIDFINCSRFWDGDPLFKDEPFWWGDDPNDDFPLSDFFPDNNPVFGLLSIPLCLAIYDSSEYSNPVLETYIISQNSTDLDGTIFVDMYVGTMSFVFLGENETEPMYASLRGDYRIHSDGSGEIFADFSGGDNNTFDFNSYSYQAGYDGNYDDQGIFGVINNFPHLSVNETGSFTATSKDGVTTTFYTKRIK